MALLRLMHLQELLVSALVMKELAFYLKHFIPKLMDIEYTHRDSQDDEGEINPGLSHRCICMSGSYF